MQDTPAVKFLWSAKIRIPKEFDAFMSAVKTTRFNYNATFDEIVFVAPVKVQAYLIALVVGDLKAQTINGTIGVISEPGQLPAVTSEFSGLWTWFNAVQSQYERNPYAWPKYDLLILPPSFAWGGMENPMLTFGSPTLIVGDKS